MDFNQFGSVRPSQTADTKLCAQFEAMLADAVDGSLTAEEQAAFDFHLLGCGPCSEMLADARRGAAWMEMLRKQAPEPPAAMLERILAQTSGAQTSGARAIATQTGEATDLAPAFAMGIPIGTAGSLASGSNVLPFRNRLSPRLDLRGIGHTLLQPRLAMTAAMAFFSIALTLNLTGVRLSNLQASDLKPSSLKRSLYTANAHVVRYYTNLRVVYELESRVHDLERSSADDLPAGSAPDSPQGSPQDASKGSQGGDGAAARDGSDAGGSKKGQQPEPPPKRRVSPGTSRRETMHGDPRVVTALALRAPDAEIWPATQASTSTLQASTSNPSDLLLPALNLHSPERGTV